MKAKTAVRAFLASYVGRMLLGTLLMHLVLIPLLFASIFLLVERDYKAQFVNFTRAQSLQLATRIGENPDAVRIRLILDDLVLSGQTLYAEYETGGRRVTPGIPMANAEFREDFFFGEHGDGIYFVVAKVERAGQPPDTLKLGFDERPLAELIATSYLRGAYIAAGYLALTLVLVGFFGHALTQSIRQLRNASHQIAGGDATTELAIHASVTEVSLLAQDLEKMRRELVRREREIALREATQRAILESAAEGIITVSGQGLIQSFNTAAESIFGYLEHEVLNTPFTRMLTDAGAGLFAGGEIHPLIRRELGGLRKSNEEFHLLLSVSETHAAGTRLFTLLAQDISERKAFEAQLKYLATHDTLTRLPNRALFNDRLAHALAHAKRGGHITALLFLDLDRFKYINDTLGHEFGDSFLVAVTERLNTCVRREDTLARLGGDEFTIVLHEIAQPEDAAVVAQKMLRELSHLFYLNSREIYITGSIGIALYPFDGGTPGDLIKHADNAMYLAKKLGGNNAQYFTAKVNNVASRLEMEAALRYAIERDELILHYQPQVDINSGRIVGLEALLRWQRPGHGTVSPLEFVPLAEETGQILAIGAWVLRAACAQVKAWQDLGHGPLSIAVNLSARQFEQPDLLDVIREILADTGVKPAQLEIELTESTVMHHVEQAISVLGELKKLGVRVAIDDFGTGYSSLSYLTRFPIDVLKIDKSFIAAITDAHDDGAIASAIIAMARMLKLKVVAEGVETAQQLAFLRARSCTVVQGYHLSRPLSAQAVTEALEAGSVVPIPA